MHGGHLLHADEVDVGGGEDEVSEGGLEGGSK